MNRVHLVYLFLLASALDLAATGYLLGSGRGAEWNPIAGWAWLHAGFLGLLGHKATFTVLVIVVCWILGGRIEAWILRFGVAATALVALWGCWITHGPGR